MRDFAEICGISLPTKTVDYKTFVKMARSKIMRLNTKIQILTTSKDEEADTLGQKYRKPEPVTVNVLQPQFQERRATQNTHLQFSTTSFPA
jgi:hypothetical protein